MAGNYEVTVRGRPSPALVLEFERPDLSAAPTPTETVLYGRLPDQAALYGLLRRIERLGLELVELCEVGTPVAAPGKAET